MRPRGDVHNRQHNTTLPNASDIYVYLVHLPLPICACCSRCCSTMISSTTTHDLLTYERTSSEDGDWRDWVFCPHVDDWGDVERQSVVCGARGKVATYAGSGIDDTLLSGFRIQCCSRTWSLDLFMCINCFPIPYIQKSFAELADSRVINIEIQLIWRISFQPNCNFNLLRATSLA